VKHITNDIIASALKPFGFTPDDRFCDRVRTYIDLLLRWNQRMSLTTVTDPVEVLRLHFGESLLAAVTVPIRHSRLADVGSGAGFPAVPIRMVSEGLSVILIESNQRKAAFLAEVIRELDLSHVDVLRCRMEDADLGDEKFDFVTARAIGIDDAFLEWSRKSLNVDGSVVLWLGESDANRILQESDWKWADPLRIPQSERRVILCGARL
jgi:16S rRNA (guanine527-N7)-methyltransferase